MENYFYSGGEQPFEHVLRCVPDPSTDHGDGVVWLNMLHQSFDFLELVDGLDYIKLNLTTFGFSTYDDANDYYMIVLNRMANNI